MNAEQRRLARHALGLDNHDSRGKSYRNRYFAHGPDAPWEAMCEAGWAYVAQPAKPGESLTMYALTRAGALLALDAGERLDPEDFPPA